MCELSNLQESFKYLHAPLMKVFNVRLTKIYRTNEKSLRCNFPVFKGMKKSGYIALTILHSQFESSVVNRDNRTHSQTHLFAHCKSTTPLFQELNLLPAVIIDNGSGLCKCGVASAPAPTHVFPAILGRPKYEEAMLGAKCQDVYLGEAAQSHRGVLKLSYPLEHGVVKDWDDMEMVGA